MKLLDIWTVFTTFWRISRYKYQTTKLAKTNPSPTASAISISIATFSKIAFFGQNYFLWHKFQDEIWILLSIFLLDNQNCTKMDEKRWFFCFCFFCYCYVYIWDAVSVYPNSTAIFQFSNYTSKFQSIWLSEASRLVCINS